MVLDASRLLCYLTLLQGLALLLLTRGCQGYVIANGNAYVLRSKYILSELAHVGNTCFALFVINLRQIRAPENAQLTDTHHHASWLMPARCGSELQHGRHWTLQVGWK
jgi:hypothetical protein